MKKNATVNYGKEILAGLEHIPEEDDVDMLDDEEGLPKDEDIEMETVETSINGMGIKTELTKKETSEIEQRLSRLHRNLGHPSNKTLYKILKASGASIHVLRLALHDQSHGCHVGKLPKAVRVASGVKYLRPMDSNGSHLSRRPTSGLTSATYHGQKGERSSNRTATE
eukprot:9102105-Pyramimonas_sp.AAC.1